MYKVMTVFGIRPDFIRSSLILKKLQAHPDVQLQFVYTGQHYDENLKGVFFKELGIPEPQYSLDTKAGSHPQQHAKLISQLEVAIKHGKPDVVMFLGDANAVIGCITPLKMGIPIAHVEAGMRSHDWRMPEERNRVIIDRVSDVLYAYQHDYKCKLVQEGIDPDRIVVTGNTIVDVMEEHMGKICEATPGVLKRFGVEERKYGVMTLHRNEHMNEEEACRILSDVHYWAVFNGMKIILPVMPRLRKILDKIPREWPSFIFTEPLGFFEFMALESRAAIEFTDSGTNQETSALWCTPCVVTRSSTERPETFDSGITVMTEKDIGAAADYVINRKVNSNFSLGKGNAAEIIVTDLVERLKVGFNNHHPTTNVFRARNWESFK